MPAVKEQEFLKKLGLKVRSLRNSKNLSLNYLDEELGLEKSSMSKLENGKSNSTILTLFRISEALKTPIDQFFKD